MTREDFEKLTAVKSEPTTPVTLSDSIGERVSKNEDTSGHPTDVSPGDIGSAETDTTIWQTRSAIEVL